jgi:hypothetical protein
MTCRAQLQRRGMGMSRRVSERPALARAPPTAAESVPVRSRDEPAPPDLSLNDAENTSRFKDRPTLNAENEQMQK